MKTKHFPLSLLSSLISVAISSSALAGHTRYDVDYQYFRDFAENKGKFTVGSHDIEVMKLDGTSAGTMLANNIPMIDFSVVDRNGIATLVGDQYVISVAHNSGYQNIQYGAEGNNPDQQRYTYRLVNRHNYPRPATASHPYQWDYHNPRVHKFVTETAPIEMVDNGMNGRTYSYSERYPMRLRIGSGTQKIRNADNTSTSLTRAYQYLTAGNSQMGGGRADGWIDLSGSILQANAYGPMPMWLDQGDSGSPLFVYDKEKQKWLVNGVLNFGNGGSANTFNVVRQGYFDEILAGDTARPIDHFANSALNTFLWKDLGNGNSTISLNNRVLTTVGLATPNNNTVTALDQGKHLYFTNFDEKNAQTLQLESSINQGAGGLYFQGDFTVQSQDPNSTWLGAGVSVSEESIVNWKVKNPQGDRLSKIGGGTLLINGTGENLGDISVGDGYLRLNQQADSNGKQQAFANVQIVSGRPTVILGADNQINPNNIAFGFRGGRLDLNGRNLTFNRIQNTDEGAQIVNHNASTTSTLTILGNAQIDNENNINRSKAIGFNGWLGETSSTLTNGRLNVNYNPIHNESQLLLSGGTNLNGVLTQSNGTLVLSGRPTPHAYAHLAVQGNKVGEVVYEDDWLNRTFKANTFDIQGGSAVVSRNVSQVQGNWTLSNNATAIFGINNQTQSLICTRSDWTGLTSCSNQTLSSKAFESLPTTNIQGNITLANNAKATITGKVTLNGNVLLKDQSQYTLSQNATQNGAITANDKTIATVDQAYLNGNVNLNQQGVFNLKNSTFRHNIRGTENTRVNLNRAHWMLSNSQQIGHFHLDDGQVSFNNPNTYSILTVLGNLSGKGTFDYLTFLENNQGNRVDVNGIASGDFSLNVRNTGKEPNSIQQLTLLSLKNPAQTGNVNIHLTTDHVDAGSYRYELAKFGNTYRLYNPKKEQELAEEKRKVEEAEQARLAEEQRKAQEAEQARLAEEQRKAQEAEQARLAEEKRKAEEAEQARLAEEKRKAQEAEQARLAEEKRKAQEAEQARLAEEQRKAQEAEQARLAEEKRKAEEAEQARLAEEKRKAQEAEQARLAEEKRKAQEAEQARLAEEKRKAEEAEQARLAEEQRKAQEAEQARLAEEKRKAEEAEQARLVEEQRKAQEAEQARLVEEQRKAEEAEQARFDARQSERKQKELVSRYANTALSELSASVNTALLVQDTLDKHLLSENRSTVWANQSYDQRRYDADEFRAYRQKTRLSQIGVQKAQDQWRVGALLSHSHGNSTFDDNVSGKHKFTMLSAFAKYQFELGIGISADVSYGVNNGTLSGAQEVKINRHFTTAGIGLDYKLQWGNISVQPNVGVRHYWISDEAYQYEQVSINTPRMSFNTYRTGVELGYRIELSPTVAITPTYAVNYVDASNSNTNVKTNQSLLDQRFDRYWQQEIGINANLANWKIGAYANQSKGNQLDKQHSVGVKVGYQW